MALQKGDMAPNFTLLNTKNEEVSLSNYKGKKVVLLFFPLAFTSVCTAELCSVRDGITDYNDLNTEVLGISVDSPFTLAKFKEDQQLNFTLLSDFNKDVSQKYESFYEDFVLGLKGVSKRAAFVIDETGAIQHSEVLKNAGDQPDFAAIKSALK